MIADEEVFDEAWVPQDVKYRHSELDHISNALRPAIEGTRDANAFIFGGSGLGKTCTTRYLIRQLDHEHAHVDIAYVNCWNRHATFDCLYALVDAVAPTHDIHRHSTAKAELVDRLRDSVSPENPLVVVLDEVDRLEHDDVIYQLDSLSGVSLLFVTNRKRDLLEMVDDRVGSRLQTGVHVRFTQYSIDELTSILQVRANRGLEPGAVTDEQLRVLADLAAGEARAAIQGLHEAAVLADSETGITEDVLEAAVTQAREKVRQKTTDRLTDHERVILSLVREAGTIGGGSLYEQYVEQVGAANARTDRTMRNYLSKMAEYNLVEKEGETRGARYHAIEDGSKS